MQFTKELYDKRNDEKQRIQFSKFRKRRVESGEIRIAKIGVNIGSEISKDYSYQRPVFILSINLGSDLVAIIPMTTKFKENYKKFYYKIRNFENYGLNKQSYLILNQIRVLSKKRLVKLINNKPLGATHIPKINKKEIGEIKKLVKGLYKL